MSKVPGEAITIEEATSLRDYMFLRRLRNQVRHLMTRDTAPISYLRQLRFFVSMRRKSPALPSCRIFIARRGKKRVGYLLTNTVAGVTRVTEVVDRPFRRQRIGRTLVAFAQSRYPEIVAEIGAENEASIALHRSMGFLLEKQQSGTAIYRYRCERREALERPGDSR
jgi:ribosomal protein S18 acetylase RimI-like enzyme